MSRLIPIVLSLVLVAACGQRVQPPAPRPADAPAVRVAPPQFEDAKPHDWDGIAPGHYAIHGIDISRWQKDINWRRAREAGVSFVYVKATEGGDILDPMFHKHRRAASDAGIRHGAYHYFYFCRPAAEQARWFIRNVPREPGALPPVLDMEWNHRSRTCTKRPDGGTVRAEARKFLDILERHYGRRPIIYTTPDFYRETGIGRLSGTEFWLRSVAGHPSEIYPGQPWVLWQYSGTGLVPGITGAVDLNVFRGSPAAWQAWSG